MSWQFGIAACALLALAFASIAVTIGVSLGRSGQLRSNHLGRATALVLLVCAIWPGGAAVYMLLPSLGVDSTGGLALREAFGWPVTAWSVISGAGVAGYWLMWRRDAAGQPGTQLFVDRRVSEQQALELNDMVLQGLVVAKMALDLDHPQRAADALEASIDSASRIITEMLGSPEATATLQRTVAAAPGVLRLGPHPEEAHEDRKSS